MGQIFRFFLIFACFTAFSPALAAPPIDTPAREAIVIEAQTGAVLFAKDPDVTMHPASMSKLMTLYLVFERLKEGSLKLDDTLPVSEKAWRMGGSKMFVKVGTRVPVEELIQGVIVDSGNDACIVLAEGLAGSEAYFAQLMTDKARELGMTTSTFVNATGWPDPEHVMTVRELAILALHIIRDFPEYYPYFKERSFTYGVSPDGKPIKQYNRNVLVFRNSGVDGLKTGHTESAGYGLTASAIRNGRRLVAVVAGLPSDKARANEAERLLDWGFRNFNTYALFKKGQRVEQALVWLGTDPAVNLIMPRDVVLTLSRRARQGLKVRLSYDAPIPAPIAKGAPLATLTISAPEMKPLKIPLLADHAVDGLGPLGKLGAAFRYLVWGASSGS